MFDGVRAIKDCDGKPQEQGKGSVQQHSDAKANRQDTATAKRFGHGETRTRISLR